MKRELWQCPKCGERFTSRNQWHACGKFSLSSLFAHSEPRVYELYQRFVELVRRVGPVIIIPQKTRVAFQVRMRFAALHPRKKFLDGHFILGRRRDNIIWITIEQLSPRNFLHRFRIRSDADYSAEFKKFLRESYRVGQQEHLRRVQKRRKPTNA